MNKLAVMQPYLFPYIGYYQLVYSSDTFVFYDDVNYINRGWINRNRILVNGLPKYFTLSLKGASQNRLIKDIEILDNRNKILKTIFIAYKKAPFFEIIYPIIEASLNSHLFSLSSIASSSIKLVFDYLEIYRNYQYSSIDYAHTRGANRAERLILITKESGSNQYINAIGGIDLYKKHEFKEHEVSLLFLKSHIDPYYQQSEDFIPGLSIIDVLMNNSKEVVRKMVTNYELV
jgi:hypothetical protein